MELEPKGPRESGEHEVECSSMHEIVIHNCAFDHGYNTRPLQPIMSGVRRAAFRLQRLTRAGFSGKLVDF